VLKFMQHPEGPKLRPIARGHLFRAYADMADYADRGGIKPGIYYIATNHRKIGPANMRLLHYHTERWPHSFWVEGLGCI